MARGITAKVGTERTSQNGYQYRRTEDGWVLIHRLIAEETLGRKLHEDEYATFADGNKKNLEPGNIIVRKRGRASIRRRLAIVQARLDELNAEKARLEAKLEIRSHL